MATKITSSGGRYYERRPTCSELEVVDGNAVSFSRIWLYRTHTSGYWRAIECRPFPRPRAGRSKGHSKRHRSFLASVVMSDSSLFSIPPPSRVFADLLKSALPPALGAYPSVLCRGPLLIMFLDNGVAFHSLLPVCLSFHVKKSARELVYPRREDTRLPPLPQPS